MPIPSQLVPPAPIPPGNPSRFGMSIFLSGSLRDNHLLPMHIVHIVYVFKLPGVGASLRGASAASLMRKILLKMSDWEPHVPSCSPWGKGRVTESQDGWS